ncbi:finTRIM family, member 86 isoform X2 [Cheilinus undulatus]|uniref:finTRIM family, member 86 isoform X2 n=1 Tax=Cheilinus undulatus TaxID=241271 RepID=UPI001BD2A3BA|nr:finTRIM family, member 86 isoform X2 [Cheilinus undulatus]
MASAWSEEETFVCSVCLETLKDPATLPCGHSYCLACIQNHWDKKDSKDTGLGRQGSIYPQLPTVEPRPCPQHNRPMNLFCHDDRECVCEVCCQHGHKGHRVLKPQEERKERQKEIVQMQTDVQKRIQDTEKQLNLLPHVARQHKALVQALEQESTDLFSELVKSVNQTGIQVGELLSTHETTLGSQVEGQIHRLEQEVVQLRWKSEELNRLAQMEDHICFLKNFFTMEPLGQAGATGELNLSEESAEVTFIRSALKELQEAIKEQCKASLAKICTLLNQDPVAPTTNGTEPAAAAGDTAAVNSDPPSAKNTVYEMTTDPPPLPPPRPQSHGSSSKSQSQRPASLHASAPPPPYLPPPKAPPPTKLGLANPDPKTRGEMLKFRFEPTFDPNTVYRHVLLSDRDHKATMRAENLNPPDHPERFDFWRQVLCREPLAGSPYYWEVEWTGQKITIGVAYKEMERKGSDDKSRLGHNDQSWSLYWSGTGFSFWHDGKEKLLGSPKARRIGIYLDQHAGILAFFRIDHNQADLIHRYQTQFTGPLYPGLRFWAGVGAEVSVCPLD